MQLVEKQGHNPGAGGGRDGFNCLNCDYFFIFIFLLAYSPLFPYLCIFQLFLRSRGDPKD